MVCVALFVLATPSVAGATVVLGLSDNRQARTTATDDTTAQQPTTEIDMPKAQLSGRMVHKLMIEANTSATHASGNKRHRLTLMQIRRTVRKRRR